MNSAKAWTSMIGPVILSLLHTYVPTMPDEATVAIAAAAVGLLTYLIPNAQKQPVAPAAGA